MKREIKFRRWVKSANKMIQAEDIYKLTDARDQQVWGSYFNPDNVEFMQYTGLKDKDGREIYEGDIVAWSDGDGEHVAGEVKWRNEVAIWAIHIGIGLNRIEPEDVWVKEAEYEVIVNIHENPELLEP